MRPKVPTPTRKPQPAPTSVRLDPEDKAAIKKLAKELGTSEHDAARRALRLGLGLVLPAAAS